MPAPKGNTYGQVWDINKSLKLFQDSLALLREDQKEHDDFIPAYEGEKPHYKINCLETLAVKLNTYSEIYWHLIKRFGSESENDLIEESDSESEKIGKEINSLKKQIGNILVSRLSEAGLHNKVNTIMSIFLLKTNHNKVESTKVDLTSSDGTIRAPQMSKEEVKGIFKEVLGDI